MDKDKNKKIWIKWLEENYASDTVYQELLTYADYCDENKFTYNPYLYSYALFLFFRINKKYNVSALDLYFLINEDQIAYKKVLYHFYKNANIKTYLSAINPELSKETVLGFLEGYRCVINAYDSDT